MMSVSQDPNPALWQTKINLLADWLKSVLLQFPFFSPLSLVLSLLADLSVAITFWQVRQVICILLANPKFSEDTAINGCGMHGISVLDWNAFSNKKDSHFWLMLLSDRQYCYEGNLQSLVLFVYIILWHTTMNLHNSCKSYRYSAIWWMNYVR